MLNAQVICARGVVCLLSAAVYYGLTTYIPDAVDVAIPRKSELSSVPDWPHFNIHYYTDARHQLGITIAEAGKDSFRIYDMEKTVVDIIFYREKNRYRGNKGNSCDIS